MSEAKANYNLLDELHGRDTLVARMTQSIVTARAAESVIADAFRDYLQLKLKLSDLDAEGVVLAALDRAGERLPSSLDDIAKSLKEDVLELIIYRKQRGLDMVSRLRKESTTRVSPATMRRIRRDRQIPVFEDESICSGRPWVVIGEPKHTQDALDVFGRSLSDYGHRVIRLSSEPSKNIHSIETAERYVLIHSPWWDTLHTNVTQLRKLLIQVGVILGGAADVVIVDDIGQRPNGLHHLGRVSQSAGVRAVDGFRKLHRLVHAQGASLIAALPLREGEIYTHADKCRLGELGYRYDLREEDGVLVAQDMAGVNHSIEEEQPE